ncbi:anti-sigma factor [Paenibacillus sp. NRS-1760]|uniref:anti-sigma factor n=1 Tax=Paenibacillus sp. NRS-1760 TaxID=3233902 RepID=UPI003D2CD625
MKQETNLCDDVEMYALGGLDEAEAKAFEQHLKSCAACTEQVAELKEIVDMLPLSSEPVAVPTGMKDRILGSILQSQETAAQPFEQPKSAIPTQEPENAKRPLSVIQADAKRRNYNSWLNIGLAAAVLLLCVYIFTLRDQVSDLSNELTLAQMNDPPQGLQTNQAVSLSSAAQNIIAQGLATIVIDSKGTHLLVQAEKLPQIKENEAFQVWLMKKGQDVINAGTFYPVDGKGGLYFTLDQNLKGYDQIAITQEPDAFGKLPRGTAVLTAELHL